jgi:AcrR family transcriptional regulator
MTLHTNDTTTEQVILDTATALFLEKGYALTSTTEIARIVGCNQALVHYYFRTKDRLFDAVFSKAAGIFTDALLLPMDENLSFEENVRRKVETHYDVMKSNPRLPFLFFNELNTNPERLSLLRTKIGEAPRSLMLQTERALNVEIEKGTVRPMTASNLLLTIFSLNLVIFLSAPVLQVLGGMTETEYEALVENRKRENVTVVLKSLRA